MVLVDTNVLLDVFENDPNWATWSQGQLDAAIATDALAINSIVYSELSIAFARIEELEAVIVKASLRVEPIPREALFLATVMQWPILTRDYRRYRTYFPTVSLITP